MSLQNLKEKIRKGGTGARLPPTLGSCSGCPGWLAKDGVPVGGRAEPHLRGLSGELELDAALWASGKEL